MPLLDLEREVLVEVNETGRGRRECDSGCETERPERRGVDACDNEDDEVTEMGVSAPADDSELELPPRPWMLRLGSCKSFTVIGLVKEMLSTVSQPFEELAWRVDGLSPNREVLEPPNDEFEDAKWGTLRLEGS